MGNREWFSLQFDTKMESGGVGEIMIYSRIVSAKWDKESPDMTAFEFDAALKKLKDADRLNIRINSPGGVVDQAVAMRSMLATHTAREKHVYIEGLCASAATLLASIPGFVVHIAEGSMYMIHNPYIFAIGDANELEKEVARLRLREEDCRAMYAKRCGKDDATIKAWMDETKWFNAQQAIGEGFADEIIEVAQAAACADFDEDTARVMHNLYGELPEDIAARAAPIIPISNAGEAASAAPAPEHTQFQQPEKEENDDMELANLTMEQITRERPDLFKQMTEAGMSAERARMQEIDDLTPPGYERMAAEAKASGASAADYLKELVKAQREKGPAFMAARAKETGPAETVLGGASTDFDQKDEMTEADALAKELAELAPDGKEM